MYDDHYPLWVALIEKMVERDLTGKTVLDFGCNQGGFLRILSGRRPFHYGIGVDVATEAIQIAEANKGNLPIHYEAVSSIGHLEERIDIAFSHEVLYLLPDLAAHAREMYAALKPGGVYYAVLGCHTDNPLWTKWELLIRQASTIPPQSYSLDDIAWAFLSNGFAAGVQKYMVDTFMSVQSHDGFFPRVKDMLDYYWDYKVLFRFVKL